MPASGIAFYYTTSYNRDNEGYYWSSSLYDENNSVCWFMSVYPNSGNMRPFNRYDRYYGMPIRPVVK